jgi:hypothetical protein
MDPRTFLRAEGLAVLGVVLAAYVELSGPLWLLAVVALAPDLSMLGDLAGPRVGGLCYNTAHTYVLPLAAGAAGYVADVRLLALGALVWAGHICADRLLGYGLKYEAGFRETHLSAQPAPVAALTDSK